MAKINKKQSVKNKKSIEAYKGNELLSKKIIRIAQFESELELGVNPSDLEQANTGYLTEKDFEYIRRIGALVEKRLKDSSWLAKTIDDIERKLAINYIPHRGIRFDDELFKVGRGILESFLKEKYKEEK
jgi:hypothetical protein